VPEQSACFHGSEVKNLPLPTNHSGLNKWYSKEVPGYRLLSNEIVGMLKSVDEERVSEQRKRHQVPFRVVSTYTNRPLLQHRIVECLRELSAGDDLAHAVTISGAGGVGKTQLVLRYIEEHGDLYDLILWIDARSEATIQSSFSRYCAALKIGVQPESASHGRNQDEIEVFALQSWLRTRTQSNDDWLFILDNADDLSISFQKYVPMGEKGTVIITSRSNSCADVLGHRSQRIEVDVMERSEATELLLQAANRTDTLTSDDSLNVADQIVVRLGLLPLAIDLAGAYIRHDSKRKPTEAMANYLEVFDQRRDTLFKMSEFSRASTYDKTVWTVWDTSFDAVAAQEDGDSTIKLMIFLTMFDNTKIQEHLFELACLGLQDVRTKLRSQVRSLPDWFLRIIQMNSHTLAWDSFVYEQAIRRLRGFNLLRSDEASTDSVTMHPLVQWRTSQKREGDQWWHWYITLMVGIAYRLNSQKKTVRFRRSLVVHLPSVSKLSQTLKAFDVGERLFAYHELGKIWEREQRLQEAEQCFAAAVEEEPGSSNANKRLLLSIRLLLARVYGKRGQVQREALLMEDVVYQYTSLFGDDDPEALKARGRLAHAYVYRAQFQKALPLCEEVHQQMTAKLGSQSEETLWASRFLARVLGELGRLSEAEILQREALAVATQIQTIGPDSPFVLFTTSDLATTLQQQDRLEEALELALKALNGLVKSYGNDNLLAQRCRENMAKIYAKQGNLDTALLLAEEVVEIASRYFGKFHDTVAMYHLTLADILWRKGRMSEACDIVERSAKVLMDTYGADAPTTQVAVETLRKMNKSVRGDHHRDNSVIGTRSRTHVDKRDQ
jgi:tetratricopeptide (TPR) repeat protein